MHIDENKKFDKRNLEKNIKNGIISKKDYDLYLSKLPDVSDKLFNPEEATNDSDEIGLKKDEEGATKKRVIKKKIKGKGK
ncbi:MAG: hypothetical protein HXY44_13395 [Syntrophaceae bacterium]|nr:hypothetical protein [Syntrophaceae bacterium]